MKANELMIGDWVCTEHDSTPRQIDWIRTGEVGLLWNKVVTPPYLVPIPLTPEILEKNGFIEDSTNGLHSTYHLLVPAGIEKNIYTVQVIFYKEPICGVSTLFKCWVRIAKELMTFICATCIMYTRCSIFFSCA